jgi:hypothetical protein
MTIKLARALVAVRAGAAAQVVGISIPLLMLIPAQGRREACPGRVSKWTRTNILPATHHAAT